VIYTLVLQVQFVLYVGKKFTNSNELYNVNAAYCTLLEI